MAAASDLARIGLDLKTLAVDTAALVTPERLLAALLGYWAALKVVIAIVAVVILVSSLDDLLIDLCHWGFALRGRFGRFRHRPPAQERLQRHPEKRIAIMVPAWQEVDVIAQMAANTINSFDYERYCLFIGVYANDPGTRGEVARVRQRFPQVKLAEVPHEGPTSKADCLNWIVQNILLYEQQTGESFDVFAMHDAEDVVHPFGLKTVNWFIEGRGMIQLPVLSMNRRWWELVACSYMDEFAEFHGKDLPVRARLAKMTPSAGVATAFSREAMLALCAERDNQPFNTDSLTEDYDVGHRLRALGMRSDFIRYVAKTLRYRKGWFRKEQVLTLRRELVATKEFFPDRWSTSVRQKARWMLGISYLGWKQLGWFGDVANRYFLYRDRKVLYTAPTGVLAYLILVQHLIYAGVVALRPELDVLPPLVDQRWVELLIEVNLVFFANRLAHRAWFTLSAHGLGYAWLAPARAVVSNLVSFGAFLRSLHIFLDHLFTGRRITWDKTSHAFPSKAEIAQSQGRLGDVLRFWNHVSAADLDAALAAQQACYRPLGRLLVDRGAIKDEHLAEAFAEAEQTFAALFDPFQIAPDVLALLTRREAARFGAVPLRRTDAGLVEVALREPLTREHRAELEHRLAKRGAKVERYLFAPLSDVAFAVRWAWTPGAFAKERATLATMRKLELVTAPVEAAVLRALRSRCLGIGDRLVRAGAIEHNILEIALKSFWSGGLRLGDHLIACGAVEAAAVDEALAAQEAETFDVIGGVTRLGLLGEADAARLREALEAEGAG